MYFGVTRAHVENRTIGEGTRSQTDERLRHARKQRARTANEHERQGDTATQSRDLAHNRQNILTYQILKRG